MNGKRINNKNLLIIDDEQETLDLLQIAMERKGYNVYTASCWEEATDQIERLENKKQRIDVVILDIMMPVRSGFDILRALHVVLVPLPPVIILSAVTGIEQQIQARDLGATKYLTKPTTPAKLSDAINSVFTQTKQ